MHRARNDASPRMWPASPPPVKSAASCGSISVTAKQATLFGSDPVLRVLRERYLLHLSVGVCFGQLARGQLATSFSALN